jgi:4-amino-4-deoxy-L-arabinose transferase-like glycosyltransferase
LQVASIPFVAGVGRLFFNVLPTQIPLVDFYLAGRAIASFASTASIFVTYIVGRRLFSSEVGLFAAGLVAICPLHIYNSALVTTDIWVAIFSTFILLYCAKLYQKSETKYYLLAGVFVGLAAGSKYTAIVFFPTIVLAHLVSQGFSVRNLVDRKLFVAGASTIITFFLTTPYAILDSEAFSSAVAADRIDYRAGHAGAEAIGDTSYDLYANVLYSPKGLGYVAVILALGSIFFASRRAYRSIILLLSMPILLFLFVGNYKTFFDRNIVGAVPALSIAAAFTVYAISQSSVYLSQNRKLSSFLYCLVFFIAAIPLATNAVNGVKQTQLPDTRWVSLNWVRDNIPRGSKIAIENYVPPVDQLEPRFVVVKLRIAGLAWNKTRRLRAIRHCQFLRL